jgi:protein-arginine kinase activator protein McsA
MAKKPRFCKLCGRKSFSVRLRKIEGGERKSHYVCKKCTDFLDTVKHPEPIVKLSKKVVKDLRDWNQWKRPLHLTRCKCVTKKINGQPE